MVEKREKWTENDLVLGFVCAHACVCVCQCVCVCACVCVVDVYKKKREGAGGGGEKEEKRRSPAAITKNILSISMNMYLFPALHS